MAKWLPIVVLFVLALPGAGARAEEPAADADAPAYTANQRDESLKKAFAYLDEHLFRQGDRGSTGKQYAAAMAGWAYVLAAERSGKRLPSRKREGKRIRDYLEQYLKEVERLYDDEPEERPASAPPRGLPPGMPPGLPGGMPPMAFTTRQYNWALGITGLFFAESYHRGREKRRSKRVLKRLAAVLSASQQPNGGWGHDDARIPGFGIPVIRVPVPGRGEMDIEYPDTLVAATNCAASGLGAAYRILRPKDATPPRMAVAYYREAQNPEGTFPYDPSQKTPKGFGGMPMLGISTALTNGSVFALHCLGVKSDDEMLVKAIRAIDAKPEDASEGHGSATLALGFGALTARVRGEETWKRFADHFFPLILAAQDEEGAFSCVCRGGPGVTCDTNPPVAALRTSTYLQQKKVYVTAIHTLILVLDRTAPKAVPPLPGPPEPKGPVTPR